MRTACIVFVLAACNPKLGETQEPPWRGITLKQMDERQEALESVNVLFAQRPTIGERCYYGGDRPRGRQAVDALVRMGRVDLLRRGLQAPSAEGRIYSAIGLIRLRVITRAELDERVSAEQGTIDVCFGCSDQQVDAREALAYYLGCSGDLDG